MSASQYGPWKQLRILRERSDIRQVALASYVGISRSHLHNLETGKRWPTAEMTARLAAALNVPSVMISRGQKRVAA